MKETKKTPTSDAKPVSMKQMVKQFAMDPLRRSARAPKPKAEEPEPEPIRRVKKGKKVGKLVKQDVQKKNGHPKKRRSDSEEEEEMQETSESDGEYTDDDDDDGRSSKQGSRSSPRKKKAVSYSELDIPFFS